MIRRRPTNRWTGATGSEFRIKRDPAKLLGSAVGRSTQPLYAFWFIPVGEANRQLACRCQCVVLLGHIVRDVFPYTHPRTTDARLFAGAHRSLVARVGLHFGHCFPGFGCVCARASDIETHRALGTISSLL